ncbi:hypothetical protein ONZ43_g1893 [Nemania bipapillata]|uniref:Uncharacterized protein n=1 Tax=Nemania bipapillata TaxID=110536 RepID=A0ACC2J2P7_9PEZI|nr:hypothetical protein ONZ43_g1893 [Nemania bipapillata]
MSPLNTFTTTVHPFPSPTSRACAYEIGPQNAKNALVFIGGLGDGPHTVAYPRAIAKQLEENPDLGYSVFEFRLKSSFSAFGFARLVDDVADTSALVKYLRSLGKERIVLMGHSTGCQDCMEYVSPVHAAPPVEGIILQAPVCDVDAMALDMGYGPLGESTKFAKQLIDAGKSGDRMPVSQLPAFMRNFPISAWRCGEDNYFSPDLPDEVAASYWTRMERPLLVLHSGADEYVPESVNTQELINRWRGLCKPGVFSELSGVIPGAGHRVEQPEAETWLSDTVIKFLRSIN